MGLLTLQTGHQRLEVLLFGELTDDTNKGPIFILESLVLLLH